jgi:hypothetical protein
MCTESLEQKTWIWILDVGLTVKTDFAWSGPYPLASWQSPCKLLATIVISNVAMSSSLVGKGNLK